MHVGILGGGFCGSFIAKYLDTQQGIETTLIDKKPYFEYSPGLHKVITKPTLLKRYRQPYTSFLTNTEIITDEIKSVTKDMVTTKHQEFFFDYLVICTGIEYPIFLKNTNNVHVLKRGEDALAIAEKLRTAESILIIGGGLIGTEIAGELVTKTPKKELTIVHLKEGLLERNQPDASYFAKKFLQKNNATIIFKEKIIEHHQKKYFTDKQKKIHADLGLWCAGIHIDPWFLNGFSSESFTPKKAIKVNHHLQMISYPHIFVGGDINNVQEEKTGLNAEHQGKIIAKNLIRIHQKKPLLSYHPHQAFQVISLGDYAGIIQYHKTVLNGLLLPGIAKAGSGIYTRLQLH